MTAHGPSRGAHRPLIALFVGLGVLALVAVPVAWCAFYAYVAGVTGWNSDPEPAVGLLWGGAALALLALPVLASLLTARASRPRGRAARTAVVVVTAGAALAAAVGCLWLRSVI